MVAHREPSAPKQPTNRAIGRDVGSPLGSSTRPRIPKNAPGTPVHGSGFAGPAHGTRPTPEPFRRVLCRLKGLALPEVRSPRKGEVKLRKPFA